MSILKYPVMQNTHMHKTSTSHYISLLLISANYATLLLVLVIVPYNDCSLSPRSLGCHGDLLADLT